MSSKRCNICKLNKRSDQFFKSKAAKYHNICKKCFYQEESKSEFFSTHEQRKLWKKHFGMNHARDEWNANLDKYLPSHSIPKYVG